MQGGDIFTATLRKGHSGYWEAVIRPMAEAVKMEAGSEGEVSDRMTRRQEVSRATLRLHLMASENRAGKPTRQKKSAPRAVPAMTGQAGRALAGSSPCRKKEGAVLGGTATHSPRHHPLLLS